VKFIVDGAAPYNRVGDLSLDVDFLGASSSLLGPLKSEVDIPNSWD
jgi:hypothetical protein